MYQIAIQNLPAMNAVACPHTGSYLRINEAFRKLSDWFAQNGGAPPGSRLVAIYFDDPTTVPEEQLHSSAGVVLPDNIHMDTPFARASIQGGPYAVLVHRGPYENLSSAYQWLYQEWLPTSGRTPAAAPVFEEYKNTPGDTAPASLITHIHLPLQL